MKPLLYGALLMLAACVTPPPKSAPPSLPQSVALTEAGQGTVWPARAWWRDFHDEVLDALISRALAQAPDLAVAAARFDAARAGVSAAQAEGGFQTGASAAASSAGTSATRRKRRYQTEQQCHRQYRNSM